MKCAPILLFTYKRLDTLKITVTALQQNLLAQDSELFIFSDAAKTERDKKVVEDVRSYIKSISGFKSVTIYESEINKGLANSIIGGVSSIIDTYGKVIVLEDDLKTTPNFLFYMNTCLEKYEMNNRIFSISGYSFNLGKDEQEISDVYLLNRGWSWGWATWKGRWKDVDWTMREYSTFKNDSRAKRDFAKGGSDLNKMLAKQMQGKSDGWAVRWFYHQFKVQGLTVYPVLSKVYNNGFDDYATHTTGSAKRYLPKIDTSAKMEVIFPIASTLSSYYQHRFQHKMGIGARIVSKIESYILKFRSVNMGNA